MITQYTAAALVNELQSMAHPTSAGSIPTSANQEDHVSMGAGAAHLLRQAVEHVEWVLAIEAVCAAAGLEARLPHTPGAGVQSAVSRLRTVVPAPNGDRSPAPDLAAARDLVAAGVLAAED
jgi:histidine ammonia-lyase